ncbi:MAG: DUF4399 domain-containing protein [Woeseiaceae bacterium]|nr:DUF4399 domain-containing protein [Woeseiaceae bacterium]
MKLRILFLSGLVFGLGACAEKSVEEPTAAVQPAAASKPAAMPRTASAEGASVFFITPANGATVTNPIQIEFGIEGMDVVKAGDNQPNSGHHHLLIDTDIPNLGLPIPADERHVHFGDGRTATEIVLPPGEHTLQMLLGDHLHIPHEPPLVSEAITITVE